MEKAQSPIENKLLARSNQGLQIISYNELKNEILPIYSHSDVQCCVVSPDGSLIAYATSKSLDLISTTKFETLASISIQYIQEIIFSFSKTYILAYARHTASKISVAILFDTLILKEVIIYIYM